MLNDIFSSKDVFEVTKEDILNEINRIDREYTSSNDETFNKNTNKVKSILKTMDDPCNINDYVWLASSAIDIWQDSALICSNDLTKVDMSIMVALFVDSYLEKTKLPYKEHVINEFETKFFTCISEVYDIKNWNINKLFGDRKDFFYYYILNEEYDQLLEQTYFLISKDYKSESFEHFDAESAIAIIDIQEMMMLKIEIKTFLESADESINSRIDKVNSDIYIKTMETNTFEERRAEVEGSGLFCKKCGKKLPADSVFCPYCGEKIVQQPIMSWGEGIPDYTDDDIMDEQDIYEFAMEFIFQEVLNKENYEIVSSTRNKDHIPSYVLKKDNKTFFLLVEGAVAPNTPSLSEERRKALVEHALKYNAKCLYASVGFGSSDAERFDKGIALKNDSYYFKFSGFESILYING